MIVEGKNGGSLYGTYLDSFTLVGGELVVRGYGQHCSINRVWVSGSTGNGFVLGNGEGIILRDCIAWGNAGHGLVVQPTGASNCVVLDHVNSQSNGGNGVHISPAVIQVTGLSPIVGECFAMTMRDCVIQGNLDSDLFVTGLTRQLRIESCWFERHNDFRSKPLIRIQPNGSYYPGNIVLDGNTVLANSTTFSIVATCLKPVIEQATILEGNGGTQATKFSGFNLDWAPSGQMRYFPASKVQFGP